MQFSGLACLDMKNICGKFRCKQTSTRKVIALAFIHVNPHGIFNWMTPTCVVPHPVHLNVWRIYAPFSKEGVNVLRAVWYFCNYELLCRSVEWIFLRYPNLERCWFIFSSV